MKKLWCLLVAAATSQPANSASTPTVTIAGPPPPNRPHRDRPAAPTPERIVGLAEIQHQQPSSGPGHAPHLAKALFEAGQIPQPVSDGDQVETVVAERNTDRVTAQKLRIEEGSRGGRPGPGPGFRH